MTKRQLKICTFRRIMYCFREKFHEQSGICIFVRPFVKKSRNMKLKSMILLSMIFMLVTCKKEKKAYTPDCSGGAKSFATDVSPLIASRCAISGCHAPGSQNGPGPLTNYNEVNAAKSRIRTAVANGTMPRNSVMTDDDRNKIVCWIDAGAANN